MTTMRGRRMPLDYATAERTKATRKLLISVAVSS